MISAGPCCRCKTEFYLPDELYHSAKRSPAISFWCPYGHEQHFAAGETDEQKLRRERDRLKQQLAERDDAIAEQRKMREQAERQVSAQKGLVTRLKNRVGRGVCPCCNRQFDNLHRHMTSKHPTYIAEDAAA